jgi:decaprenylphospho-beta-D-erythro-pentofuranosid-2-ulose 2-reductase
LGQSDQAAGRKNNKRRPTDANFVRGTGIQKALPGSAGPLRELGTEPIESAGPKQEDSMKEATLRMRQTADQAQVATGVAQKDTEHPALRLRSKNIMVVGAGSAIAQAACETLAEGGKNLCLVVRRSSDAQGLLRDLRARAPHGTRVELVQADYLDVQAPDDAIEEAEELLGPLDGLLVAFGYMPDECLCRQDPQVAQEVVEANFGAPVRWLNAAAARMQASVEAGEINCGVLAAISSVAGFRPRASLSLYASSKAGLSGFLEALAGRVADSGLRVVDLRPGPTASKMTAHLAGKRRLADPRSLAPAMVAAMASSRPWRVAYLPGHWRWIAMALRHVPFAIFRRLPI